MTRLVFNNNKIAAIFSLMFFMIQVVNAQELEKVINFSKGMWHSGLTMSINDSQDENIDNILFDVIDNSGSGFEINVLGGYFLKDNMSTGVRYNYLKREHDLVYSIDEGEARYQSAKARHTFTGFLRNYYPISKNNRFSFFNETDLSVGFGNSNTRHTRSADDITKTFTDEFNLLLGVKPGVGVVLTKGFAFEVAVDLLGLTYSNKDLKKDGISEGNSTDFNFDFDISLLSLDFGLAYYF